MGVVERITDVVSFLATAALIWAYASFALRRARRVRDAAAALDAANAPLRPGFGWVHGVARKVRGAESDVLLSGRNVTVRVQSGRSQFWQREETTRDLGPFYVVTSDGQKVRVKPRNDGSDRIEVAANEHNTYERRVVDYELRDGDEVWVEGAIEEKRTPAPGKGYREPGTRSRWRLHAGDGRVTVRTRGVVDAHRTTALVPGGLTSSRSCSP